MLNKIFEAPPCLNKAWNTALLSPEKEMIVNYLILFLQQFCIWIKLAKLVKYLEK